MVSVVCEISSIIMFRVSDVNCLSSFLNTGGFLAGHCIGQHPDIFKVAAMRNPCMNIASMVTATDIPDWCYVETLGSG